MTENSQEVIHSTARDGAYRGLYRLIRIPSCAVSVSELRRLYNDLSEKTKEALEKHLSSLPTPTNEQRGQFENLKNEVRAIGRLTVTVIGANGEQTVDTSVVPLNDDQLPDIVTTIVFNSSAALENHNVLPLNRFKLTLDFTEPPGLHAYDPWERPTPNNSVLEVIGADKTWVTAVYAATVAFFNHRGRGRAWLHTPVTFAVLHWFIGFPGALWIVYRFDSTYTSVFERMHGALRGAIYVYLVLLSLLLFRLIIGGFRWTFPLVELEGARSKKMRGFLAAGLGSLLLALLYDVLKTIFWKQA